MAKLEFKSNKRPTIGVELELSLVDAETRELAGERVDIVPWANDASLLISRALSPAIRPLPSRMPMAMGRSKEAACLGSSAGARLMRSAASGRLPVSLRPESAQAVR